VDFQKFGGLLGLYRVKCRYFGRWARVFQADKTLKQVQGDKKGRAVIPNLIRNRKVEVDKLKSCCRKRDFSVLATLKQVQGDEKACFHYKSNSK